MTKYYVHLTETERELIASMHWKGKGPSEIARVLGLPHVTLYEPYMNRRMTNHMYGGVRG